MALLGSPFPIELSDGLQFAQLGEWEWVNRFNGLDSSLDPAAHSEQLAFQRRELRRLLRGLRVPRRHLPQLSDRVSRVVAESRR